MAASIFGGKSILAGKEALNTALKDTQVLWDKTLDSSGGREEWKFCSKAAGRTLQVKKGKRTLFCLMPKVGWFQMIFICGERAASAAQSFELPGKVLDDFKNSSVCRRTLSCGRYLFKYGYGYSEKNAAAETGILSITAQ